MYNGHRSLKSTKELKLMSKVSNNSIESGRELLRENPHARDHSNKKQLNQSNNYQLQISSILGEALLMHALFDWSRVWGLTDCSTLIEFTGSFLFCV